MSRRKVSQTIPLSSIWGFVLAYACELELKHPETGLQRGSSKFQVSLKRFFFSSASMLPAKRGREKFCAWGIKIYHPTFEVDLHDLDSVFLTPAQESEITFFLILKKEKKRLFSRCQFFSF